MGQKAWGDSCWTTLVRVDGYQNQILTGRIEHPLLPQGKSFQNLMEFLQEMEYLLDNIQLPQAYTSMRTFSDRAVRQTRSPPDPGLKKNDLATFMVRVLFRQNASWQGSVKWVETGQEEPFRSVLELLLLMNSAVSKEPLEASKK